MTFPTEPIRPPLVEPTVPARKVERRLREERDEGKRRHEHESRPERPQGDEDDDGHVDVRV